MTNYAYPLASDKIVNPLSITIQFKTLTGNSFGSLGEAQRKAQREYPTRALGVKHVGLDADDMSSLYQFYIDRRGSYDDFPFFLPSTWEDVTYEDEYVGTGDGSTFLFNLPIAGGSDYTIYVDGEEQTESVDYDYGNADGASSEDTITFDSGSIPDDGDLITIDVTGRLKIRCFFANDELSWDQFSDILINSSLKLQGILNI